MIHKLGYYKTTNWYTRKHLIDWLTCLGIFVTEQILTNFVINPYKRYEPDGSEFQLALYPLLDDIVPTWLLLTIGLLLPTCVFVSYYIYYRNSHDLHHALLGLFETFTFTMLFTDFLKITAGRYRPDYQSRLSTHNASIIRDGRLSFPSGHSSLSFSTMAFLSLYLCGKLKIFRKDGGAVWKVLVVLAPYAISSTIAISRTIDYHHDFSDILGGSFIGLAMGVFIYFMNFNSLFSKECSLPKNRIHPNYAKDILTSDGLLYPERDTYTSLSISSAY
ncbi:phosphoesterase [Tieghemostelium lacteum]|uniref:Phosphoesterase n=1 Tax=Tieghemostelium lacteum TaxID=361077 RepID=A0A151ZS44_TIELA|nr:phosphoesterase [Tieghemostelium lacteum]|eukprot:KYQ96797.1 phosphoesterase [Tieghemostelium lacteum]